MKKRSWFGGHKKIKKRKLQFESRKLIYQEEYESCKLSICTFDVFVDKTKYIFSFLKFLFTRYCILNIVVFPKIYSSYVRVVGVLPLSMYLNSTWKETLIRPLEENKNEIEDEDVEADLFNVVFTNLRENILALVINATLAFYMLEYLTKVISWFSFLDRPVIFFVKKLFYRYKWSFLKKFTLRNDYFRVVNFGKIFFLAMSEYQKTVNFLQIFNLLQIRLKLINFHGLGLIPPFTTSRNNI
uniref:7fae8852-68bb-4be8-ab96-d773018724d9-CDS n=1 Tax=Plasmodiophora brassicae TaxID=37360 RepID=A0A3P3YW85_PLABS|nr:7fae8852-68bb-4be8-ab96-d773018724d9-CDS [Plasmodiophora brassicae]